MRIRRKIAAFLAVLLASAALAVTTPTPAVASCPGNSWPSTGFLQTEHFSGGEHKASFGFKLTQSELNTLRCVSQYLEIDFHLIGFYLPNEWDDYWVVSTNLPGAVHDVAYGDTPGQPTPSVTGIPTTSLNAGQFYTVTLGWRELDPARTAYVWMAWVPSHWASNPYEWGSCNGVGGGMNKPWCIFPTSGETVFLRSSVGIPTGQPRFNGVQTYSWAPNGRWSDIRPESSGSSQPAQPPLATGGGTPTYDGVIRISGTNGLGVNLRAQPNSSAARVGGLAEGTVVHPECYAHGQNIGGTTLWWRVNGGYYSAFYDTTPLEWQDEIEQRYGIQSCATADSDGDGVRNLDDACVNQAGLAQLRGCPPSHTRRDIAWYDGSTLWGFKGPGLDTVASKLGYGRPEWAGVGDYDHDGTEDLFWYHESSTTIYVIPGGDFSRAYVARGPGIGKPVWAGVGDFDGNGFRDDIAWYDGRMLFLFKGAGLPTVFAIAGYSPPDWAGVGDANQDGKDDLFWYHGGGNGTIYGLNSTGSGFAGAYAIRGPGIGAPQWAGVGDFDGNGKRNDLAWYSGGVLFTFTGPGLPTTGTRYGYAMNDWAGVGQCDTSGRDSLFWYHGQGNGTIYCIHNNGREFTNASAIRGPGIGQPVWAGTGNLYP